MSWEVGSIEEAMRRIAARCRPEEFELYGRIHADAIKRYIRPTDRVLDFGCGIGRILKHMPPNVEGYDPTPSMRRFAKIYCGRDVLATLKGREHYYDVVYECWVIQHLQPSVIGEILRVLKPGGIFITISSVDMPQHPVALEPLDARIVPKMEIMRVFRNRPLRYDV